MEIWEPTIPTYYNTIYTTAEFHHVFCSAPVGNHYSLHRHYLQNVDAKKCQGNATTANQQAEFKAKENFPKMLIIVVLIFSLYWLPIEVYTMIELYSSSFCLKFNSALPCPFFVYCQLCNKSINLHRICREIINGFKNIGKCCLIFLSDDLPGIRSTPHLGFNRESPFGNTSLSWAEDN